jgi:Mrp family chromosome partitioning ATPase
MSPCIQMPTPRDWVHSVSSPQPEIGATGPGVLESMWRYRYTTIALALLGAFLGYIVAAQQAPVYEAESQLLLADPRTAGIFGEQRTGVADTNRYIRNQVEFIRTGAANAVASEILDGRLTPAQIGRRIVADTRGETDLITITATDSGANEAAELADAVAVAYQRVVGDQVMASATEAVTELQQRNEELSATLRGIPDAEGQDATAEGERAALLAQIAANEGRIQQLTVDAALFGSGVDVFAPAEIPTAPVRPQPVRSSLLGLMLAGAVAAGIAWWRNSRGRVVERSSDPAEVLQAPLLGEVPEFPAVSRARDLPTIKSPHSRAAEGYQFVVSSLLVAIDDVDGNALVMVTSARPGEGKTVTAANLAVAAQRDGREVHLLDADLRMRGLTRLLEDGEPTLNLRNGHGPFDWVNGRIMLEGDVALSFMTVNDHVEDPAGYFRTPDFRRSLLRLRAQEGLTLVDAPPLLAVADSSAMARHMDGLVIVVSRYTAVRDLQELKSRCDFIGVPILGYIFNRAQTRGSMYGYHSDESYRKGVKSAHESTWAAKTPTKARTADGSESLRRRARS